MLETGSLVYAMTLPPGYLRRRRGHRIVLHDRSAERRRLLIGLFHALDPDDKYIIRLKLFLDLIHLRLVSGKAPNGSALFFTAATSMI